MRLIFWFWQGELMVAIEIIKYLSHLTFICIAYCSYFPNKFLGDHIALSILRLTALMLSTAINFAVATVAEVPSSQDLRRENGITRNTSTDQIDSVPLAMDEFRNSCHPTFYSPTEGSYACPQPPKLASTHCVT